MNITVTHKGIARKIITQAAIISDNGESVEVSALWDTGATSSMITDEVAKKIDLENVGFTKCTHAAGVVTSPVYSAAVEIQGGLKIRRIGLVGLPNDIHAFGMIIGMDIISLGKFCLENKNGNSVFTFEY